MSLKALELSDAELGLLAALFSADGLNIPIKAAPIATSLQGKLSALLPTDGPKLVTDKGV